MHLYECSLSTLAVAKTSLLHLLFESFLHKDWKYSKDSWAPPKSVLNLKHWWFFPTVDAPVINLNRKAIAWVEGMLSFRNFINRQ